MGQLLPSGIGRDGLIFSAVNGFMGGASVRKMRDQQKTEGEMGEGLLYWCC